MDNFLELKLEDANEVDMDLYRFVDYDRFRGIYVFALRRQKGGAS